MTNLLTRSIDIILENQSSTGAYPASPNFVTYRYSWFRDGAFIAYAMDLAGQHESARRFHHWAATVINRRAAVVERAVYKAQQGKPLAKEDVLDTRYSLDGHAGDEEWPNFQLDGFGTWLWALEQHRQLAAKPLAQNLMLAADLVAGYLEALWQRPCYDCWEEFPDQVHIYTVATIYAGLRAHAALKEAKHSSLLAEIKRFARQEGASGGHFVKYVGSTHVDASLLGLAVPYALVTPSDPLIRATVEQIEIKLRKIGGVHRYSADTYYGGGAWTLLTAWLGWYYAESGDLDRALAALTWVEGQANDSGYLPEQVPDAMTKPDGLTAWRRRWGEIAAPLLWSHAKYIILYLAVQEKDISPK